MSNPNLRIALMGEPMLEMSHPTGQGARLAYGGDVLNTAIYLARLGVLPHLVTALGCDPYSDGLLKDWERECVAGSTGRCNTLAEPLSRCLIFEGLSGTLVELSCYRI